jgi:hypothetical protein
MAEGPFPPDFESRRRSAVAGFTEAARLASADFQLPLMPAPSVVTNTEANWASRFREHLGGYVARFEASLDPDKAVGARLVNFGQTFVIYLEGIGFQNPSLIVFSGRTQEGDPVELIQHVSQISVLLVAIPRPDPNEPRRFMGLLPPKDAPEDAGE